MISTSLTRRGVLGLSTAALTAVGLASCTGAPADDAGGTSSGGGSSDTLRLFTFRDNDTIDLLKDQVAAFDEEAGVTTTVNSLPGSGAAQYPDKLRTELLGGSGPDVWRMWGGQIGAPFVEAGQAADLSGYYDSFGWTDRVNPNATEAMNFGGVQGGVPFIANAIGFWYSKEALAAAGFDAPPQSYAELEQLNDDLVGAGITPCGLGGKFGWHIMRLFEYLLEVSAGPELHDQLLVGEASWDTPEVVDAFTAFKKWQDRGWLPDGALGLDPADIGPAFIRGDAAYSLETTSIEQQINDSGQDREGFGTAIAPTDHETVRYSGFVEGFMLNANSANIEKAAELIDFLITPQAQVALKVPTSTIAGAEPDAEVFPGAAQWSQMSQEHPFYTIQDQAFPKEQADQYFTVQSDILQGSITPAEAAARMDEIITSWVQG